MATTGKTESRFPWWIIGAVIGGIVGFLIAGKSFDLSEWGIPSTIAGFAMGAGAYFLWRYLKNKLDPLTIFFIVLGLVAIATTASVAIMSGWIPAVAVGTIFVLFGTIIYMAGVIMYRLGKKDKYFTLSRAGQIVAVMRGEDFDHYLMWVEGYIFRCWKKGRKGIKSDWEIIRGDFRPSLLNLFFGVEWIGLHPFRTINVFDFRWKKWASGSEGEKAVGDFVLLSKADRVSSMFFRYPYGVEANRYEDKERLPLDIGVQANLETVNPYQSQFITSGNAGDWINAVTAAILAVLRDFVGSLSYEQLIKLQSESGGITVPAPGSVPEAFVEFMLKVNEHIPKANAGIVELYGQKLISINLVRIELSPDEDGEVRSATTKKYRATQEADAKVEEARGIRAIGDATAAAFNAIGAAAGGQGAEMYKAEKLSDVRGTLVMGAGSGVGVMVGTGTSPPAPPALPLAGSPPPSGSPTGSGSP